MAIIETGTNNSTFAATTASAELIPDRFGNRTVFAISNQTSGATVTITKGSTPAVAGSGIVLFYGQSYVESNDSGFQCWQGSIQVVASAAANVSVSETLILG